MKTYLDLVGEYARAHKKKNRITILCIAIAVCLVTAIFGMADMEVRTRTISAIKDYGKYHVLFKDIDNETADLIGSRADTAVSGWVHHTGYGKLNGKQLEVLCSEEAISREMGLAVINGRYPEKPDEALLDRQAVEQFGISLHDRITVTLPGGTEGKYTIVGVYGDFASLKVQDAHGMILPSEGLKAVTATADVSRYYVQFKNGVNMRQAIDEIKANYNLSDQQVHENTVLLALVGQSRDSYMMKLYMTAAVLFLLVLAAGALMIASSFNMSVLERVQFFGLLRCLGASKAQVGKYVMLEGIQFSLKGIPIGLVMGIIIVWVSTAFLKYVNPAFFRDMPLLGISWPSLLAGIAVGFFTVVLASLSPCRKAAKVSPLSAVTGNVNQNSMTQYKAAARTKHIRVDTAMGIQHAFASKKNILLMMGSFAISIVLFLSFSVMINFMHQAVKPLRPYVPDISIVSGDNSCSLDPKLPEQIKNNHDVKRVYGRMFAHDIPAASSGGEGKLNLISYEQNQFNWAGEELTRGSIDKVIKGKGDVLLVYAEDSPWQIGDSITLKLPSGDKTVKIAGMLATSPFDSAPGTQTVICSENLFRGLTGARGYTVIDMQLAEGAGDDTVDRMRSLATSQMRFSDRRQSNDEARTAFYSFAIFVYGFLFIIASITVFNIINSINMSVTGRMNQYGVMRAVGMAGKQLHRMVIAEAAAYSICGCIAGCVLGLPLHRVIFQGMITSRWGLPWEVPYAALAAIAAITVLTALLSVIGPVKKINKMDIVNVVNSL